MAQRRIRITHRRSRTVLAEGPLGWAITPFEGNYYVGRKHLRTARLKPNFVPGFCIYKFLYVWLDLDLGDQGKVKNLGWMYWLPNPLFPFIWYRVGLPATHPELLVETLTEKSDGGQ